MNNQEDLAERLYRIRKKRGIGLVDAADGAGLYLNTLKQFELGIWKPRDYQLKALAQLYNVTTDWLLNGELNDEV